MTLRPCPTIVISSERIAHAMLLAKRRDEARAERRSARRRRWAAVRAWFDFNGRECAHGGTHGN